MKCVSNIKESCLTYEWVMYHINTKHVSHIKESCLTYEWVMYHINTKCVSHINESCHTYKRVMYSMKMNYVTHINQSCLTYNRVMSTTSMGHVHHMNKSRRAVVRAQTDRGHLAHTLLGPRRLSTRELDLGCRWPPCWSLFVDRHDAQSAHENAPAARCAALCLFLILILFLFLFRCANFSQLHDRHTQKPRRGNPLEQRNTGRHSQAPLLNWVFKLAM